MAKLVGKHAHIPAIGTKRIALAGLIVLGFATWGNANEPGKTLPPARPPIPPHLPSYDLDITFDPTTHRAKIRERVTWTNTTTKPTQQMVFNFYPHFQVPAGEALLFAKTLELLRLQPSLGIDRDGRMGEVRTALWLSPNGHRQSLRWSYEPKNPTAIYFDLPQAIEPGQSATIELVCEVRLPNKQGRWGHYEGVTYLTNAIPLLAVIDDNGWKPMPFVPWHQPWYNEAGHFRATITVPENETVACSAAIRREIRLGNGQKRVECEPFVGRDFAVLASARYQEFTGQTQLLDGRVVKLRVVAFPEHEFYATEILKIIGEAIPVYSQWFGSYPYGHFTVAESYFGWNGNECAGLVMIDERVFGMPHLARGYVEYLVSHETCHQWWYNLIGTNGYTEPFLDEGAAAYFTHRLMDLKHGKNNPFLKWPQELAWLPNIHRENYRYGSMYHAIRNNEMMPAAQELPQYKHLFGLFTGAYDRGSKVFHMIEAQLGEAAFFDFITAIVQKYSWRILSANQFQAELEAYTARDWSEFFTRWVYGQGLTDWSVESVRVEAVVADSGPRLFGWRRRGWRFFGWSPPVLRWKATTIVRQSRELTEPTLVRFRRGPDELSVPVGSYTQPTRYHDATITPLGQERWRIEVELPFEPEQVEVDPERVLLDANPGNNAWKTPVKTRLTPLYTSLDETNLTTDYDKWNIIAGPWVWGPAVQDPWYTRSTMAGLRVGGYRTEKYTLGAYTAIRSDYRDAVVGADARLYAAHREFGVNWETRIGGPWFGQSGGGGPHRGSIYARNIHRESSSLYLPPMFYDEWFATYQDNFLPFPRTLGGDRYQRLWMAGWHLRLNLYTPYWDPECGLWADAVVAGGQAEFHAWKPMAQARLELAGVQALGEWAGPFERVRLAVRGVSQFATPEPGQFFALGGGTLYRGFDLAQRQGSFLWVANVELRWPLASNVLWDALDHCLGARNVWLATFYDVGAVYANRRLVGGNVAHAIGIGLRVDVAIFSFIERATLRFDVAQSLIGGTPLQFWFGIQHAF
ncbi:MAG: M1 family aminopeptidase [Gemmataceae bacterium]|nr:M1 family aminopeptidase [Gemmata sp.]MDW8196812.1 M1 family aminopeptidase [Gemmataceae bacterium]